MNVLTKFTLEVSLSDDGEGVEVEMDFEPSVSEETQGPVAAVATHIIKAMKAFSATVTNYTED